MDGYEATQRHNWDPYPYPEQQNGPKPIASTANRLMNITTNELTSSAKSFWLLIREMPVKACDGCGVSPQRNWANGKLLKQSVI